ncbi:MAG: O-antigen ligase family protein [Clostridia bacterium]|nr:O-antigen ligase family protein [Clostridia bacterium]
MIKALQSSLFIRLVQAVCGWVIAVFRGSSILNTVGRWIRSSRFFRMIVRLLGRQDTAVQTAGCTNRLQKANGWFAGRNRLSDCLQDSLLWRIFAAIGRCAQNSRILRWVFSAGMTGVILFAVGLYALIDYVLRDVLAVPVLSSGWDELLLLFAVLWIIIERIGKKPAIEAKANPLDLPVLLFITVGFCLMCFNDPYPGIQLDGFRATVQYMLWFFLVTRLMRNDRDFHILYLTLVGLATVIALHGIYQYIVKVPMPSNWVAAAETAVRTRVYSIFGSPNIMGDFMVMFVPMAAALAYYTGDQRLQLLAWLAAIVMCFACLFTMSRGAWAALAVAILIFVLFVDRRLFLLLFAGGILLLFIPFVRTRIGFLFTDDFVAANTNGGRGGRLINAMALLRSYSPTFGVGLGMFGGAIGMQNQVLDWIDYFYVDNYYLKILVEMGYFGLCFFILTLVCLLGCLARSIYRTGISMKRGTDKTYPLAVGMSAGLCGVLVHCSAENIFEEPYMMVYFWAIAAMVVWLGFLRSRKSEA